MPVIGNFLSSHKSGASGGGPSVNPDFISTWDTTKAGSASDTVVLPLSSGGTYSGKIDWGDGSESVLSYANRTHVYASSGIYTITLSGTMVGFRFNNSGDKAKITDISNWGELTPTPNGCFLGCSNLDVSATDAPIITGNNLDYMFYNCSSLTTADFSKWDTSSITTAKGTFQNCYYFNGQLDNWVHSGVTSLHTFFFNCDRFAGNLDSWDTSGVTNWYETFRGANWFNASMAGWVIRGNMHGSFLCNSNNTLQGIGMDTWDVSQMTRFGAYNCSSLNPDVTNWDTSALLIAQGCWQSCSSFNRSMANWDVNQVTNFTNFMLGSRLSTANYDATLIAWDAQGIMAYSGTVNFGGSKYTAGGAAEAEDIPK
jgi:surface protein